MLKNIKKEFKESKTLLLFGFLRGLGLVAPLVIARFFSEDMFGIYTLAKLAVFFFITLLINTPLVPFVVFAGKEKTETGKINKTFSIQSVFFVFGVILSAILILLFNSRIRSFAGVTVAELIYMSLGFVGIAISYFLSNLFLAMGQRIKSAMAEFAFGAITLGIVIVLCFTGKLNLRTIFGAYFVSAVIVLVIFARTIDVAMLRPFQFDSGRFREMFNFTKWVIIGASATYFIDWGDNVILKIFHISLADIGQYGLAYSIFNGLVTLIYVLNSYFLPFVSQNVQDSAKMRDYLFKKRPRILLFGVVLLAAVFIACPFLFKVFYPDSYHESVFVLRILLVGCVLVLYFTFYTPLVNALQLYRFSQTANVVHMIIKIALNVVLIRLWGFYGSAAGTVVSYLCLTVIYEYYYQRKIKRLIKI